MKKKIIKLLCVFFSLIFALAAVPFSASAARVTVKDTDVMSDLFRLEGFDINSYPKNEKSDFCTLIAFHEYGYDFNKLWHDYGLYIYIYNPSGNEIPDSAANQIQMSAGENGKYKKYPLMMLSKSDDNVFYKFKVGVTDSFVYDLIPSGRKYCVSGMELKHKGARDASEYAIKSVFEYSGFDSYHGSDRSATSTLRCKTETLETVSLELHDASWKTATSDKGANHQYEISTVYIAVPNFFLEKYGSTEDLYNGLYAVACEWYEYKVNGLVTNHDLLYQQASALKGQNIGMGSDDVPFVFKVIRPSKGVRAAYNHSHVWWEFSNGGGIPEHATYRMDDYEYILSLHNVLKYSSDEFNVISSSNLKKEILDKNGSVVNSFDFVDSGRIKGYNKNEFTVEDGKLNMQISSYASNHNAIWDWLSKNYYTGLWVDKNGYSEIEVIKKILSDDLEGSASSAAEKLFISESDYSDLVSFYADSEKNNCTVYLLRFAVTDYVFSEILVQKPDMGVITDYTYRDSKHYYFEKTIFSDFDIIDLTFENESNVKVNLPVLASPITIVGTITPGPTTGGNDGREDNASGCANFGVFDALLLMLGVVAILALVVFIVRVVRLIKRKFYKPYRRLNSSHRRYKPRYYKKKR